jgi:quercetin dioxygenase-like cupin family protein
MDSIRPEQQLQWRIRSMKRLSTLLAVVAWGLTTMTVLATPGSGGSAAILADAVFDPIATSQMAGRESVIQDVTIAPGGHTGWHTHPGGTVILVESGTFTIYNDACAATVVAAGRGIVEPGGQIQLARNEGTDPLVLTVVYFDVTSPDGPIRTDAAAPACAAGAGLPTTAAGSGVTGAIVDRATFAGASTITGADERRVVVQSATFAPGGHSGWHSHPGATVIYVVSGTFSFYSTDCVRQNFAAGQGVVEPGGGVQLARNEGTEPLVLFVVYFDVPLTPAGAFRIDQPEPATCPGLAPVAATATPTAAPTTAPTTAPTAAAPILPNTSVTTTGDGTIPDTAAFLGVVGSLGLLGALVAYRRRSVGR